MPFAHLTRSLLRSLLRIEPGEGLRAGLMLLYSVAAVGGVVITGQLAGRVLFISTLPSADIPYKYMLPPLVLMLTTALYARIAPRFRRDRLILGCSALMLAGVLVFRLLLETGWRQEFVLLCALFAFFNVVVMIVVLQMWTLAGDLFNPREARRLFGLIAAGSTLSNVIFGALLSWFAKQVDPADLLFVMAAGLVCSALCAGVLGYCCREALETTAEPERQHHASTEENSILGTFRAMLQSPLLVSLAAIVILVDLVSRIADYQLDLALQDHYGGDSQGMVEFLGLFRFWSGACACAVQFFLAGRLLERFGVAVLLLFLPASIALGTGAILLSGGILWAAVMPRACDIVLKYTVNDTLINLLYLPVGARLRSRAKALLEGMVKPPVVGLLGVFFLLAGQSGSAAVLYWAVPVLVLVGVWALLALRASRQYVAALSESIQLRRFDPDREVVHLMDESSVRVLIETLHSPDAMRVVHALDLLPRLSGIDWKPHLAMLLDHDEAEVRVLVLEYLSEPGAAAYAEQVREKLRDPEARVRAAALGALCALEQSGAVQTVVPFLQDSDPSIRAAAIVGLVKYAGLDGLLHAGESLKALLTGAEPQTRLEGIRVLEVLQAPSFYHPLIELLEDESMEVQIGTLRAAAKIKAPELVPLILPKLHSPLLRRHAVEAAVQCLGDDLSVLERVLQDERQPVVVRQQVIGILGRQHADEAVQMLLEQLQAVDDPVRGAAGEALLQLRASGYRMPLVDERVVGVFGAELQRAYELCVWRWNSGDEKDGLLLKEALEIRLGQVRERLLVLLDLRYPEIPAAWLRDSLGRESAELRATVLELIDNVVERETKELLLPMLTRSEEDLQQVARRQLGLGRQSLGARIEALIRAADPWLRCCALYEVGRRRLAELPPLVEAALGAEEPLVRETAQAARVQLEKSQNDDLEGEGDRGMALSTLEKVLFLKSVPLFEQIPGEDIVAMVPIIHEIEIKSGQDFIKKGEEGDCLYILVEGEIVSRFEEGERISRTREVIGELAVLSEHARTADCTALSDVVALRIDKKDFWALMKEQPQITIEVMRGIVNRYL